MNNKSLLQLKSLDKNYKYWLNDAKQLVNSLKNVYKQIDLIKYLQIEEKLNIFEKYILNLNNDKAKVREISLNHNDNIIVFARTIIPNNTYEIFEQEFKNLGTNPIGENFLFKNKDITRNKFIIRSQNQQQFEKEIITKLNIDSKKIYSRSSIFYYKEKYKLLITEYFVNIEKLINDKKVVNSNDN